MPRLTAPKVCTGREIHAVSKERKAIRAASLQKREPMTRLDEVSQKTPRAGFRRVQDINATKPIPFRPHKHWKSIMGGSFSRGCDKMCDTLCGSGGLNCLP